MKSNLSRAVAGSFLLALGIYALGFLAIGHLRTRKGPWAVSYQTNAGGDPTIVVHQPFLGISNVTLRFLKESVAATNLPHTVRFDSPKAAGPFGETVFIDPTFLPGTVALNLFGHEVQFMPRVLTVNRKEIPWQSGLLLELAPEDKRQSRPPSKP